MSSSCFSPRPLEKAAAMPSHALEAEDAALQPLPRRREPGRGGAHPELKFNGDLSLKTP
jgi:hypothetical protein